MASKLEWNVKHIKQLLVTNNMIGTNLYFVILQKEVSTQ